MRAAMTALALVLLLVWPRVGAATPAERLAEARDAFRLGQYDRAIPLLTYLLYPDARLSNRADLLEAHVLLAVAHFETGNRSEARREVEEALFLDSELRLDPLLFSDEAVDFFEERKQAFLERSQRDEEARKIAEERDRLREVLSNMIVIERKSYVINFVPFGAGQFQNGQNKKGIFFAVSQAVLGGTSAGLWIWQWSKYGLDGVVPENEANEVLRAQQVEIATGAACIGLVIWGIIDALIYYESTTQRPADESLIPDDLKPRSSRRRSWQVAPSTEGVGAVLRWEF
ncbi:hypothetical protein [Haliangium sp.]|uniref:hypothetical protein n=1 Tax=Haliangium sp. TaxID=2663208 RepID=UPI003D0B7674